MELKDYVVTRQLNPLRPPKEVLWTRPFGSSKRRTRQIFWAQIFLLSSGGCLTPEAGFTFTGWPRFATLFSLVGNQASDKDHYDQRVGN